MSYESPHNVVSPKASWDLAEVLVDGGEGDVPTLSVRGTKNRGSQCDGTERRTPRMETRRVTGILPGLCSTRRFREALWLSSQETRLRLPQRS